MLRIHKAKLEGAKKFIIWGTGSPRREFLHVSDLAKASAEILTLSDEQFKEVSSSHLNIGTGVDVTIEELSQTLCDVIGYKGQINFDTEKPDGTPKKLLDVARVRSISWKPEITLVEGLEQTYAWFVDNYEHLRDS